MASARFDLAAERLEHHTSLSRLEARGTLRLVLKHAGLDPKRVTALELSVVFDKLMPAELEARGVTDAAEVCRRTLDDLSALQKDDGARGASDPDQVFRRLAGD